MLESAESFIFLILFDLRGITQSVSGFRGTNLEEGLSFMSTLYFGNGSSFPFLRQDIERGLITDWSKVATEELLPMMTSVAFAMENKPQSVPQLVFDIS